MSESGTFRTWLIWPTMSVDGDEADLAGTNPKKTPSRHWREDCDQVINLEVTGPRSVVWQVSVMILPAMPECFNNAVFLTQLSSDDNRRSCPLYSSSAPAAPVTAANQPDQQQKDNGSDKGVYDQSNNADPEVNTKSRQEPIANKGADQTDYQITH